SLDTSIANTALPAFAAALHATSAQSVWVINAFQLAVVASLLPLAALGDRYGPRRVFLGGLALFTAASLACALSTSLLALTLARVVQGMGAAGTMAVNIALIRQIFPASQLGRGVGLNAMVVGTSFALGPTVASLILSVASWPWLFAINVPLGLAALALAVQGVPAASGRNHGFDKLAAALTAVTFATLVLGMSAAAQRESWWLIAAPLGVSVMAGALLLRRQASHPAPMLPVDLFKRPLFALSALTSVCSFTTQGLAFVALPFYFEQVMHRSQIDTGFLMTPWSLVVALAAPFAGRLSDRHHPGLLGGVGLTILSAGMVSMALLTPQASALTIGLQMAVCGIGFGLFQSPNLKAMMSSAPPERASGASGVIAMVRLIGQTTGAALVALCLGLGGAQGSMWALALGAAFAGVAALASFARMVVHPAVP
ncbi:MAG: MFS transporter, partial [Burkholderiaceae bacterium]|nr:MFS transporter [Burkholderiaceae bacterium]